MESWNEHFIQNEFCKISGYRHNKITSSWTSESKKSRKFKIPKELKSTN